VHLHVQPVRHLVVLKFIKCMNQNYKKNSKFVTVIQFSAIKYCIREHH
jgi:hypothetical protein